MWGIQPNFILVGWNLAEEQRRMVLLGWFLGKYSRSAKNQVCFFFRQYLLMLLDYSIVGIVVIAVQDRGNVTGCLLKALVSCITQVLPGLGCQG